MQKKGIKIEMALIDDAKSIVNQLTKQSQSLSAETRAIIVAKKNLSDKIDKLRQDVSPAKKLVSEFNQQLKNLGITEPTSIINNLELAIEEAVKTANNFEKEFLS